MYPPRMFTSNVFHPTRASGSFWCLAVPTHVSASNPNSQKKTSVCVDSPRTLAERGYGTRIRDEDVESPKARKERLCCPLSARRLAHVHYQHEHLHTRYSFEDRALSREEGHDTVRRTDTRGRCIPLTLCLQNCSARGVVSLLEQALALEISGMAPQRNNSACTALHADHFYAQVAPCANENGKSLFQHFTRVNC